MSSFLALITCSRFELTFKGFMTGSSTVETSGRLNSLILGLFFSLRIMSFSLFLIFLYFNFLYRYLLIL